MTKDEDSDDALPSARVDVIEQNGRARDGRLACEIGEHINVETDLLASYFLAKWEPIVFDALLVAAGVEFCDKVKRRPKFSWGRAFELRVPVSDPECWKSPQVHD